MLRSLVLFSKIKGSHLYRNVHDENPYTRKWIVIHTNMYMTKTHLKEMDSHPYRNVHDKNPYTRKWIVSHTHMYMTKNHSIEMEKTVQFKLDVDTKLFINNYK